MELIEEPFSIDVVLRVVRGILVKRTILKEQRAA